MLRQFIEFTASEGFTSWRGLIVYDDAHTRSKALGLQFIRLQTARKGRSVVQCGEGRERKRLVERSEREKTGDRQERPFLCVFVLFALFAFLGKRRGSSGQRRH